MKMLERAQSSDERASGKFCKNHLKYRYLTGIFIFCRYLYCSHKFLAASSSDSETTQVRKSVIHAKYFHLPTKVLRAHSGLSRSSLSLVIVPDQEVVPAQI